MPKLAECAICHLNSKSNYGLAGMTKLVMYKSKFMNGLIMSQAYICNEQCKSMYRSSPIQQLNYSLLKKDIFEGLVGFFCFVLFLCGRCSHAFNHARTISFYHLQNCTEVMYTMTTTRLLSTVYVQPLYFPPLIIYPSSLILVSVLTYCSESLALTKNTLLSS